ncbi:unnamed protein product [Dovyalis caffra]|uniref:Uncharacterized protein n=1 Tax=Dovyalis caffra TaxID=77055 RepID=A0AAV1RJ07_9ROSI|nr:unnamed protein product [Dovyalis caffra]
MGGAQALKRIPRIKFPQRHSSKSSGNGSQPQEALRAGNADQDFFSSMKVSTSVGGKASLQPKRTPISNEEIEAILEIEIASLGGMLPFGVNSNFIEVHEVANGIGMCWVDASELLMEL